MTIINTIHPVETRAREILAEIGIFENPYFRELAGGQMTKEAFAKSQEQFYFAVAFYSRPMNMLLARMPDPEERLGILHNIVDEHGSFDLQHCHPSTFRQFLKTIGCTITKETPMLPAVHSFNNVLTTVCAFEELEVGISAMGVIELAFAEISAKIGTAAVDRGFVSRSELVHYTLHAELDEKHADDFFKLVHQSWSNPGKRAAIEQGLRLGAFIFDRLYKELLIVGSLGVPCETKKTTVNCVLGGTCSGTCMGQCQ